MEKNSSKEAVAWVMYVADKGKDSCPACLANHGKKFSTKDPNLPILPIHPNCRCKYIQVSSPQKAHNKVQELGEEGNTHKTHGEYLEYVMNEFIKNN